MKYDITAMVADKDIEAVKKYIQFSFNKRRAEKPVAFYINFIKLYCYFPETMHIFLKKIPAIGYWKDYLHILKLSHNEQLNLKILNILLKRFRKDIELFNSSKPFSMLPKWLPRENTHFDKRCNFVERFVNMAYKDIPNIKGRKMKYRQQIAAMNKQLDTTEIKLCAKQTSMIDYSKVPILCFNKNYNSFLKDDKSKANLGAFLSQQYAKYNVSHYVSEVINTVDPFKLAVLDKVWAETGMEKYLAYFQKMFGSLEGRTCILDLCQEAYPTKACLMTGLAMVLYSGYHKGPAVSMVAKREVYELDKYLAKLTRPTDIIKRIFQESSHTPIEKIRFDVINNNNNSQALVVSPRPDVCEQIVAGVLQWCIADKRYTKESDNVHIGIYGFKKRFNKMAKMTEKVLKNDTIIARKLTERMYIIHRIIGGFLLLCTIAVIIGMVSST